MSLLEIIQLIGYSTAAALPFWIGVSLWKRRHAALSKIDRVLLAVAFSMGLWHTSNLVLALHKMFGLDVARWVTVLRLADTVAVISVTLTYSFLLHVHLHLWANARSRTLTRTERVRVYLSYLPLLFLAVAVPQLWSGAYAAIFDKLQNLLLAFALWAVYVLVLTAVTDLLIARRTRDAGEKRLLQALAASFFAIGGLLFAVYVLGLGAGTIAGAYLKTLANLGSLLPTALLAYHIYRYRYLELILKESLILSSLAAIVLIAYLYGIRTIGEYLTARYEVRAGAIESLLILSLVLAALPLRAWLDRRFHQLFQREAAIYRDVALRIGEYAGGYQQLSDLLRFVEERVVAGLNLRRVQFVIRRVPGAEAAHAFHDNPPAHFERTEVDGSDAARQREILEKLGEAEPEIIEGDPLLSEYGFALAYPLCREQRRIGLMLVDADAAVLTYEVRSTLEVLAGQVAIAIEDCRLVEENIRLGRRLAHGERLAALGQMAATVAHEVKNPLSAIKSIAQVMREDEYVSREYRRDLDLIVGETDRLSRSVMQMLKFSRRAPPTGAARPVEDVVRAVIQVMSVEAAKRCVTIKSSFDETPCELSGPIAAALTDALSNLVLNALQATPRAGGVVWIETAVIGRTLNVSVTDEGPGVAVELRERIWEPFFTTRQRGTGLGLAIVRKRIEEVGGSASLASDSDGDGATGGARFVLRVPLNY